MVRPSWVVLCGVALWACDSGELQKERAAGYEDGYTSGHEIGRALGRDEGYAKGREDGAHETTVEYEKQGATVGLLVGLLVGAGLVVFLTRRYVIAELRDATRRRRVKKLFGGRGAPLEEPLYSEVLSIGLRKQALEDEMAGDPGELVRELRERLRPNFALMGKRIVQLAGLLQSLRSEQKSISLDEVALGRRITELDARLSALEPGPERSQVEEALHIERRALDAFRKNTANIRRCELKLTSFRSLLDGIAMELGNLRALDQDDAFDRFAEQVHRAVDELDQTFQIALAELAETQGNTRERSM